MKTILATTGPQIKGEKTELASDATPGSSVTLTVDSTEGFEANDYIVVGQLGRETAELQKISSVTDDTNLVVNDLNFNHKTNEPVQQFLYNQRKFYGAESEDGTYNELTSDGSPVTISVDNPSGTSMEYTGSTYRWFKATYYNSTTGTETDLSDADAMKADESDHYTTIDNIRQKAGIVDNPFYANHQVDIKREQAENEVKSSITARYTLPLSYVPHIVEYVTTVLAAGYILYEEYPDTDHGKKMLGEARGILKGIRDGSHRLLGSDEKELSRAGDGTAPSGSPSVDEEDDNLPAFTRNQVF